MFSSCHPGKWYIFSRSRIIALVVPIFYLLVRYFMAIERSKALSIIGRLMVVQIKGNSVHDRAEPKWEQTNKQTNERFRGIDRDARHSLGQNQGIETTKKKCACEQHLCQKNLCGFCFLFSRLSGWCHLSIYPCSDVPNYKMTASFDTAFSCSDDFGKSIIAKNFYPDMVYIYKTQWDVPICLRVRRVWLLFFSFSLYGMVLSLWIDYGCPRPITVARNCSCASSHAFWNAIADDFWRSINSISISRASSLKHFFHQMAIPGNGVAL